MDPRAGVLAPAVGTSVRGRLVAEIPRDRVLRALATTSAATVCLAAPSGYGKSTVVRQWAEGDRRPFVVVPAQPVACDARLIVEKTLAAMRVAGLISDDAVLPPPGDTLAWQVAFLPALAAVVAQVPEPVVVVVDDAASLSGPDWDGLLDLLADNLPDGSTVCVATRGDTPRALRSRRARQDVLELGVETLALDMTESAQVLADLGVRLTDDEFLLFLERTEGWPALVYLAGLAVRDGRVPTDLPAASASVFGDYVRDTVLDELDPSTVTFLLTTSVRTELTGPFCTALTGMDGALGLLRSLASTYNLLLPLDSTGSRFRLPHVLADVLSDELRARSLDDWHEAHAAASVFLEQSGDIDGAVYHATLAEDDERLGDLVWAHGPRLLGSGRVTVIRKWIDAIDPAILERIPRLAVIAAWEAQHLGDHAAMGHYYGIADAACTRAECLDLRVYVDLLGAGLGLDGVAEMERVASECVRRLPMADPWRAAAQFHRGAAMMLEGRADEATEELQSARHAAHAHGMPLVEAVSLSAAILAADSAGAHSTVQRMLDELRTIVDRNHFEYAVVSALAYATSAFGYVLAGRVAEARPHAEMALRLTSLLKGTVPWFSVCGSLLLAQVFVALGDVGRASVLLDHAQDSYGPMSRCTVNDDLLEKTREAVAGFGPAQMGPDQLTLAEIRVLQYLPTHLTFPEIATDLVVSRFTVKTQALAVYRKLGVHSRREAVEKARTLGMLARV